MNLSLRGMAEGVTASLQGWEPSTGGLGEAAIWPGTNLKASQMEAEKLTATRVLGKADNEKLTARMEEEPKPVQAPQTDAEAMTAVEGEKKVEETTVEEPVDKGGEGGVVAGGEDVENIAS
jgi:hypothetical protein